MAVAHEADFAFAGFVDDAERIAINGDGHVEAPRRVDGKGAGGGAAFGDFGKERIERLNDGGAARVAHNCRLVEAELLRLEQFERSAADGKKAPALAACAFSGAPAKLGLGFLQGVHHDEGRTKLCVRRFDDRRLIRIRRLVFGPKVALHEEARTDRFGAVAAGFRLLDGQSTLARRALENQSDHAFGRESVLSKHLGTKPHSSARVDCQESRSSESTSRSCIEGFY